MTSTVSRKRVAVVQPVMVPGGGTEAVTAWTIEALQNHYDVSLITFSSVNAETLNRYYGTELNDGIYSTVRPKLPTFLNRTNRFLLLKDHLMMRYCKSVGKRFDLFISVGGPMDFGAPAIQYMSLAPGSTLVKVLEHDPAVPTLYRLFKRTFMRLAELISAFAQERMLQNTTLVNSQWTGDLTQRLYGLPGYEVVYPPVNFTAAQAEWDSRENGFLCIARISPEKRIEQAIEILKRVRERGFDLSLRIVGRQDNHQYLRIIKGLCQENSPWVELEEALPRNELSLLMGKCKYGINAATDEPFGIALAEMVTAGCIVFVPNSGGQTEIVEDPNLIYDDVDDAVGKIVQVLDNAELQESHRHRLADREKVLSAQAFCGGMQRVVGEFFDPQ